MDDTYRDLNEPLGWSVSSLRNILLLGCLSSGVLEVQELGKRLGLTILRSWIVWWIQPRVSQPMVF